MSQTNLISLEVLQLFIKCQELQTKGISIIEIMVNIREHNSQQDDKVHIRIKIYRKLIFYNNR